MKHILQKMKSGETEVAEVPCPSVTPGHLLIQTRASLISAGTERMLVELGRGNWLQKARQQPERVRQVLDKVKTDGLLPTLEAVHAKLDQPLPLGYCNAGVVLDVGPGVEGFRAGDRVVSNGPHAEVVRVPTNLCAKIPSVVADEMATFAIPGAIGLQGIRLAQPTLGERFVVTGLGLIGLLAVQLLHAHGCRALGIDPDPTRRALARQFGAETLDLSIEEDPVSAAMAFSGGQGVDGVLIAAATRSSRPVQQAARMCRKRGRIVLVGVTGLELRRADFYEKELSFQVSCSYGPGRYDPEYEEKGHDYPIGYVRWTEQRNLEAVLELMALGRLQVGPLISATVPIERASEAYDRLLQGGALGLVITYAAPEESAKEAAAQRTIALPPSRDSHASAGPVVGVIGAGNFTGQVLLPALRAAHARLKIIAGSGGVGAAHLGRKFGFERSTTDPGAILSDPEVHAVFITTRHDTHARFVCEALAAGKHVFVEKPLALNQAELEQITRMYDALLASGSSPVLMVGFNRRFAPHGIRMKALLDALQEPKCLLATVNAGAIPADHWTQDPQVGGGRIIGEACHFIDLMGFLVGRPVTRVQAMMAGRPAERTGREDRVTLTLAFADGSIGTVHYLANGHKSFPKERLEVFCAGRVLALDNFRKLKGYGWKGFQSMRLWRQDKGHRAEVGAFLDAVKNAERSPLPPEEAFHVTQVTFKVMEALLTGQGVAL